jgi:hypothetical protein
LNRQPTGGNGEVGAGGAMPAGPIGAVDGNAPGLAMIGPGGQHAGGGGGHALLVLGRKQLLLPQLRQPIEEAAVSPASARIIANRVIVCLHCDSLY